MTNLMTLQNATYYRKESLGEPEVLSCDTQRSFHEDGIRTNFVKGLSIGDYTNLTDEELYLGLANGELPEDAFIELFRRLRVLVLYKARRYMSSLSMDKDDMCQEAMILLWNIIMRKNYTTEKGKFYRYYFPAWEKRLQHLWRNFVLKNPVPYPMKWDWGYMEPQGDHVLHWEPKADEYREKIRLNAEKMYQKRKMQKHHEKAA